MNEVTYYEVFTVGQKKKKNWRQLVKTRSKSLIEEQNIQRLVHREILSPGGTCIIELNIEKGNERSYSG